MARTWFSHWSMINSIEVLELPDSRGESRCYFDRLAPFNPIWQAIDSLSHKPSDEQLSREKLEGARTLRCRCRTISFIRIRSARHRPLFARQRADSIHVFSSVPACGSTELASSGEMIFFTGAPSSLSFSAWPTRFRGRRQGAIERIVGALHSAQLFT